ncbi:MAG: hypothetical protein FWD27_08815, partial [Coriobacteriia bacterium]|nr:hypothetical protein [Coriobacteriia bacterium]
HARSAANTNYNAGAARVSAAIPMGIVFTPSNLTATANVGAGVNGRVPINVWNTSTTAKTITLRGTAGTSNATDPALFNSAGTRIAYQNFSSWNFTYTITLGAGASWSGLVGTGGDVARSYTVTATFS